MKIDKYGIAHFYDGGEGGGGDPSGGSDPGGGGGGSDPGGGPGGSDLSSENFSDYSYDAGPGPGGTDPRSEISSVFGGTGRGPNIAGPMSPEDPEVLADYASGRIGYNWSSPLGREARSILDQLEDMGYGKMEGINPRNPSQTVDNLIASSRTNWAIENLGIPALIASIPGAGTFMGLTRGIAGLLSGQITPGKFGTDLGLAALARSIGVPSGILGSLARGDIGGAARSAGMGAVSSGLGRALGVPAGVVGVGLNALMNAAGSGGGGRSSGAGPDSSGIEFSGVGGTQTYDPTEELRKSFLPSDRPAMAGGYGMYDPYQLADVRPGLQKTPYGMLV